MEKYSLSHHINNEASNKNIPLNVFAELTYSCNLNCYYCFQKNYKKSKELSKKQWANILRELAQLGSFYITFSGGEPFVRQDFMSILSYARKYNFAVSIITNGTLLTERTCSEMEEIGIMDISISLHAANNNLHDELTGFSGSFDKALSSIRLLKKNGFNVIIKHSVSNRNFGEYITLNKIALQEGCILECDSLILPSIQGMVSPFALNKKQQYTFLMDMEIKQNVKPRQPSINENMHCDAGRSICGITPYGSVFPCILLPIEFGNVAQKSIRDIWNGDKSTSFRNQEKNLDHVCETCTLTTSCSRCHAIAFMESGKWNSKSKSLCDRAIAFSKVIDVENT